MTIAGIRIEPTATTVAGLEPEIAANSAQATTAPSPSPPGQWPTSEVAKRIMRLATPPWVRKLPARMKNGIAMISNFSMPVNSFSATDSIGTWVKVNRKVSTVRPSEIDTGMPVIIRPASSAKMMMAFMRGLPSALSSPRLAWRCPSIAADAGRRSMRKTRVLLARRRQRHLFDALDMAVVMVRQFAGAQEAHAHLQEAEAHQRRAERHRAIDDPGRHLEVGRGRAFEQASMFSPSALNTA